MAHPLISQLEANAALKVAKDHIAVLKQENERLQCKLSLLAEDYQRAAEESQQRFNLVLTVLGGK